MPSAGFAAFALAGGDGGCALIIRPIILLTICATLLLLVVSRLRCQKLKERHALVFIFISIPFLLLAVWPNLIELASAVLDISISTVMLLGVSVFLILLIFELLTIVSVLDRRISTLAQMVGILNEKLHLMERRQSAKLRDEAFGGQPEESTSEVPRVLRAPLERPSSTEALATTAVGAVPSQLEPSGTGNR